MPKISEITLIRHCNTPTLTIRKETTIAELPQHIGACYGKITAYLKENDAQIADIPFVLYHNFDFKKMDVEIGFPVVKKIKGEGEIRASAIPEQDMIFCMYQGAYNKIEPTYKAMYQWAVDHGLEVEEKVYEFYYNGLEVEEDLLLTKILMPVKNA
ncbi:GyrI-like domain-containing protein [Eubacteriaceae bacterium ES2]|nr:GyrI-like domain-containing protein [Eubacteriaceae bacterium ES2]